jgi:hypothetical protein
MAGDTIDSTLQLRVSALLKAGGNINAGTGLKVYVFLSKIKAKAAIALDSLLNITNTYINEYNITDSVNIDYVDLNHANIQFLCDNRAKSGIDLYIAAEYHNLWQKAACINKNINKYTDISAFTAKDSGNFYSGNVLEGKKNISGGQNSAFATLDIDSVRMFPQWIDTSSVIRVDFFIKNIPCGNWDTVTSADSLIFTVRPNTVTFSEMAGTTVKEFQKACDTQTIKTPFPFPESDKDSLRNSFYLNRVSADMVLNMDIADSAFIDSLLINFKTLSPLKAGTITDTDMTFGTIKKGVKFSRSLDIADELNTFPDSIKIVSSATIPAGTRLRWQNDKVSSGDQTGVMTVKSFIDYKLTAFFDCNISRLTTIDLGADTFTLNEKSVKTFRKMENKSFGLNLRVVNNSNINIRLFALFAPGKLNTGIFIDSMGTNTVNDYVTDSTGKTENAGYVNLLGYKGIYIPPRDSLSDDSVKLDDSQLSRILSSNRGGIRWLLKFQPAARDSLINTDNVEIRSRLRLEGVNNMDSLFSVNE